MNLAASKIKTKHSQYIVHFFILLKETWKIRDNLYICLLLLTSVETIQLVCIDML